MWGTKMEKGHTWKGSQPYQLTDEWENSVKAYTGEDSEADRKSWARSQDPVLGDKPTGKKESLPLNEEIQNKDVLL